MNTFSSFGPRLRRRGLSGIIPVLPSLLAAGVVLALPVSMGRGAPLGQNRLSLGSVGGASGATVAVPLDLANEDAVSGIQVDVLFDSTVANFTGLAIATRAAGMTISYDVLPSPNRVRLVMYFFPRDSIPAGDGAVANLNFRLVGEAGTATELTPLASPAAELSDPNGIALPVTVESGYLTVTGGTDPTGACCGMSGNCSLAMQAACTAGVWQGANTACTPNPCPPPLADTLSIGTGSGASGAEVTVPLGLHNARSISGIQLDILFDETVVSSTSAVITSRATGMSIRTSALSAGRMRVLMYSVHGDSISAGDGAVANLTFRVIGAEGAGCDLIPDAVVLSDPDAQELPATATAGHIAVTGGGDPTGACCAPAGTCSLVTQPGCTAGTWQGPNTTCSPNPCPPPPPADTLAVGGGSGPSGGQITIPIDLANHVPVRGIQADIRIDPAVLRFESGAATSRVGSMFFGVSSPTTDRVRILFYHSDSTSTLAPGRGAVANLVFKITGADGSRSSLTPAEIVIAGANNQEIPTLGSAGQVLVIGGGAPPDLRLAVLKNPGRTRTLQIFVLSDVALDAPPTVGLSGGVAVPVTQIPGVNSFQGNTSVDDSTASVTVQATGVHGGATGTAQTTVTF
jgi:carbon monoxide dehydrogenase subunit G